MKLTMLVLSLSLAVFAQDHPAGEHHAPPAPKNLKLLTPDHLMDTMHAFSTAMGQKCDFCHAEGDFASDAKPEKEMARKMIVMVREINAKFPDGKMHVTCYTCHRGSEEPATKPPEANKAESK